MVRRVSIEFLNSEDLEGCHGWAVGTEGAIISDASKERLRANEKASKPTKQFDSGKVINTFRGEDE